MSCIILAACVSNDLTQTQDKLVTDQTFGRYHEVLEPELIVITMTPEQQALLTEMKPVPIGVQLPPKYSEFLNGLNARYGLTRVANWPLASIGVFCVVFEVDDPDKRDTVVAALSQEPGVETAQIVQGFDSLSQEYNDPYLSMQHGVFSIQAIRSHQWSRGEGARVAVIDTGMDNTHPDLISNSESVRNFVDSDEVAFRLDAHGTAVAGVIAAETNNETGMVGVAPDASLLALKACWQISDVGGTARCNSLTLAKALNYSIEESVDVINLSLTGPPDALLERLVSKALARGIVVVGAHPPHQDAAFPVSVPGIITADMPEHNSQSILAPGRKVLSTFPNEQYQFFSGSSFSTAHISGLAALIRSASPSLPPSDVLALIESTVDPDTGVINACQAVAKIGRSRIGQQLSVDC